MADVTMPRLSDSMEEGTIVRWIVADGDQISAGEELVEIETDKATMAYEAEVSGILRILAQEGSTVAVGKPIGQIGDGSAAPAPEPTRAAPSATGPARPVASPTLAVGSSNGRDRVRASPVARRLAAARGVDLQTLSGSGPQGRIVKRDVESVAAAPAVPEGRYSGESNRQPLTATQSTIARRMVEAKATMPEFTVTTDIDMEAAVQLRGQAGALPERRAPSLGDFVIKACALALREHPRINASFADGAIELHPRINIGVAVAAEGSLLVPTVVDADSRSLREISEDVRRLAERGRAGQLTPAEMSGATFTVSNLGMYGVTQFTAVLNPPQAAILAVGTVEQRAVVHEGQLAARQRMTVTLTADHRVIYGADAAAFLASVREYLEQPLRLVI